MRPLPNIPRGPRRRRRPTPETILVACPRVAPDWELKALQTLMKPKDFRRAAIEHAKPQQLWPEHGAERISEVSRELAESLGHEVSPQFPIAGDYYALVIMSGDRALQALATAIAFSRALPGVWFTVDRLFVLDGAVHRRQRGYKLELTRAKDVHLPRDLRQRLRHLL